MALIDGDVSETDVALAASIVARYGQGRDLAEVTMKVQLPDGSSYLLPTQPLHKDNIPKHWHV